MKRHIEIGGVKRPLNWIRDKHSHTRKSKAMAMGAIPPMVDLTAYAPPIYDQGACGSCTAHAWARAIEYVQLMELRKKLNGPEEIGPEYTPISRMGFYFNERLIRGTTLEDSGAAISDGATAAETWGIWREELWPYTQDDLFLQPTQDCYAEGANHIIKCAALNQIADGDLLAIKSSIAQGYPVVFGTLLFSSFNQANEGGMVPIPDPNNEEFLGGHALAIMGYDDVSRRFKIHNSWGTGWGKDGMCFFPYSYVGAVSLSNDFWTIRI